MESLIDFLNYQPLCGELECGPMQMTGIRMIHFVLFLLVIISSWYAWKAGGDE